MATLLYLALTNILEYPLRAIIFLLKSTNIRGCSLVLSLDHSEAHLNAIEETHYAQYALLRQFRQSRFGGEVGDPR